MRKRNNVSLEYLRSLFYLDDKIPHGLRWKIKKAIRTNVGDAAGSLNGRYYQTKINDKNYKNHRIIFCMFNNVEMCDIDEIDHIDQNPGNNHSSNLRMATASENQRNRKKRNDNSSGYIGATFNKQVGKYQAQLMINKGNNHIGYFTTAESAAKAYDNYLRTNFPSPFNQYNFPE